MIIKHENMTKYAVLSDIHGNLIALKAVLADLENKEIHGLILLGDMIDYGMQSNEVVDTIKTISYPIICNLWGNHEYAIINQHYDRFSSQRGAECAKYTASILTQNTRLYLEQNKNDGFLEFELDEKKCLAIHGSINDSFWKGIISENVRGDYSKYDIVFSGHTHYSHFFQKFYPIENEKERNRKSVYFLNPGSVGQPRNHNSRAQYAIIDVSSLEVQFCAVSYDIKSVQSLYKGEIDNFYKERLEYGV